MAALVTYTLLGLHTEGNAGLVMLIVVCTAVLGSATGLLTSTFAKTEFQAMQFLPATVMPPDPAVRPDPAA
nr:ABC transporter permease [Candidatus Protofrankia californiensis]